MTAASWQTDPSGRHELRWWDGQRWTDHVNDHGLTSVDPLTPAAPTGQYPTTGQYPPTQAYQPTGQQPLQPPAAQQPTAAQAQYQPQYQQQYPPQLPPTMAQPTVQQPTIAQQQYLPQGAWSSAPPPNRVPLIVGGIVAVVAIGVGAFFLLKGDDKKATLGDTTTIAVDTSVPDTTAPQETTTEPSTTTLPGVVLDGQTMVNLMPLDSEVPDDWVRSADPDPAPQSQSGPGMGFCGGANSIGRAQLAGSNAQAYGPTWDLPDQSVFYVDMYAFPSADEASDYLNAILKDANSCTGTGVQFTMPETDAQWFTDPSFDSAVWAIDETAGATKMSDTKSDDAVQAFVDDNFSTSVEEVDYSVTASTIIVYERWGSVVIAYSLYGRWAYTGWAGPSDFEHQPTIDELNTAIDLVRGGIISRLQSAGAI